MEPVKFGSLFTLTRRPSSTSSHQAKTDLGASLIPKADLLLADLQSFKERIKKDGGDEITLSQKGSTWYVYTGPNFTEPVDPLVIRWLGRIEKDHPDYWSTSILYKAPEPPKEAKAKVIWDLKHLEIIV